MLLPKEAKRPGAGIRAVSIKQCAPYAFAVQASLNERCVSIKK